MGPSPSPSSSVAVDILVFFGSGSCGEDGECSMLEATEMEIARFNELSITVCVIEGICSDWYTLVKP